MPTHCERLPFTAVPHTTPLFRDFLYDFQRVRAFYTADPADREQLVAIARNLKHDSSVRGAVASALTRQNRELGASDRVLGNIERLRHGAVAAVSGQQVGLFGGPLYSILKAVSAIRLARDLTAQGVECIPVFWLATEDHDLAEVNHVTLLNPEGMPERLQTTSSGPEAAPVSEVRLGEEIVPVVARAVELLGAGPVADAVRDSYRPGESMGTAFGRLFARLFADYGLVLLDASDPELHALAAPLYQQAIEQAEALNRAFQQRGRELQAAGYHEQVKVTPQTTLLFEKRHGSRTVIHRSGTGFRIGRDEVSADDLLGRIRSTPHRFSANVLLRPVVQDYLLPTVAYFGGPAEVAYFGQADVVYRQLLGRTTPVLPRFSATLLDARAQRLLPKYGLHLPDFFAGPDAIRERIARQQVPPELAAQFDESSVILTNIVHRLANSLERLDPTLVRSAQRSGRKISHQFERLRRRAGDAELRRNQEIERHAAWLSATLYPGKDLQEREIAGVSFLARHGTELLQRLVDAAGPCLDHQVLYP